jgi:peroxiredoxin
MSYEADAATHCRMSRLHPVYPCFMPCQIICYLLRCDPSVPCKHSFPELDKLYKDYQGRGFNLVAVSVDEKAEALQKFLEAHPVAFPTVHDAAQKLVAAAGVESMPTSFLVDRRGVIRFVHVGFRGAATVKELRQELEQLLTEK